MHQAGEKSSGLCWIRLAQLRRPILHKVGHPPHQYAENQYLIFCHLFLWDLIFLSDFIVLTFDAYFLHPWYLFCSGSRCGWCTLARTSSRLWYLWSIFDYLVFSWYQTEKISDIWVKISDTCNLVVISYLVSNDLVFRHLSNFWSNLHWERVIGIRYRVVIFSRYPP